MIEPRHVRNADDVRELLADRSELTHIHTALVDMTGQMRGKTYSVAKFLEGLDSGLSITSNFAAADFNDVLLPVEGLLAGDVEYRDSAAAIVPGSVREIPWESPRRNLLFLLQYDDDKADFACARSLLQAQLRRAESMGLRFFGSFELEFRLFHESLAEASARGFRDLTPCPKRPQYMGLLRHQTDNDYLNGLLDTLYDLDVDIEAYHTELDVGFHEVVLRYSEGSQSADDCAITKTFTKAFSQRFGRVASFMPRPFADKDGSSFHTHISLQALDGSSAFYDANADDNMSQLMRFFIGGMQRLLPEFTLMLAPTVNAYRRFLPGLFAPVCATWGRDNRTVGLRVMGDSPKSLRVENRLAGADANPYLIHAATLAAGIWGIENKVEPTPESMGHTWSKLDETPDWQFIPTSFDAAIQRFENSTAARSIFGDEFVRVFTSSRRFQSEAYKAYLLEEGVDGEAVTAWEYERFFELA